jgi:mRNA interferase MazF
VLVLSHELFNRKSETAIVMALTSQPQKAGWPVSLALPAKRLPKPSWVKITQVRTISVERLGKRLAVLDSETLSSVVGGLVELIG